jgi:transcriptional regulator with XRE-family HTH domain
MLKTPVEIMEDLALRIKSKRLELNLTQEGISSRSGVSLGSLKRFESTGQISLESLLKIAHAVNSLSEFETLFTPQKNRTSLFEKTPVQKKRQRGKLK